MEVYASVIVGNDSPDDGNDSPDDGNGIDSPGDGYLCAAFGNENSVWVYSAKRKSHDENDNPKSPSVISQRKMDADLQNNTTRRLINETHGIFLDLQQLENAPTASKKASLVTFSRHYRSVLRACLLNLQSDDPSLRGHIEEFDQIKLFSFIELVWHLCEILLIESLPGGVVLQHLLDWVKLHRNNADQLAREVADSSEPAENPKYWPANFRLLLQGSTNEVQDLLALHPDRNPSDDDQFTIVEKLLKKMPSFKSFIGHSEFTMKWNYWQQECRSRCSQGQLASNNELLLIAQILCGDNDAFAEVKERFPDLSWYELLVAKLFYSNPMIKSYELQYHTQFCLDLCGGREELETWHVILLAAIEFDVHAVIKISSECFGNWWFVAHMADLFHHCGQLETGRMQIGYGIDLREFLLLEYASSLMSHQSLWLVATDYFLHCPTRGRHYLEEYIERLPLENEFKAFKVLQLCKKLDFSKHALSICKQMGMKALQHNRLGSALSWCIRAKDPAFASFISERFTDEYFAKGEFSDLDLIDHLGSSMLLCDRLTFLGKYREFHLMYENGDFIEAGNLLISLITSNLAPKRIWLSLLTDALPLLEHEQIVFTSNQTYELMHCLEEVRLSFKSADYIGTSEGSSGDTKDKDEQEENWSSKTSDGDKSVLFQPIRLALARNLSRSLLLDD